jgi:curved DNA-binding protein CbpA
MADRMRSGRPGARDFDADPYEVLQVSRHASPEVIHAAYRALARGYHPDVNGGHENVRMRSLNAAYATLSDPDRRTAYDARTRILRSQEIRQLQTRPRMPGEPPIGRPMREVPAGAGGSRPIPASAMRSGVSRAVLLATIAVIALIVLSAAVGVWAISSALDDSSLSNPIEQLHDLGEVRSVAAQPFLNSR